MSWEKGIVMGFVVAALASAASAQEQKIGRSEVPETVLKTVEATYPRVPLLGFSKEAEDGRLAYEIALDWKGRRTEVVVSPEGRILIEEVTIGIDEVPAAVRKGLASSKYGSAKLTRIEKVTETDRASTFEIVVDQGGEKHELVFAGYGEIQSDEKLGTKPSAPASLGVTPGVDFPS